MQLNRFVLLVVWMGPAPVHVMATVTLDATELQGVLGVMVVCRLADCTFDATLKSPALARSPQTVTFGVPNPKLVDTFRNQDVSSVVPLGPATVWRLRKREIEVCVGSLGLKLNDASTDVLL